MFSKYLVNFRDRKSHGVIECQRETFAQQYCVPRFILRGYTGTSQNTAMYVKLAEFHELDSTGHVH